jgi:hypothetical protein
MFHIPTRIEVAERIDLAEKLVQVPLKFRAEPGHGTKRDNLRLALHRFAGSLGELLKAFQRILNGQIALAMTYQ